MSNNISPLVPLGIGVALGMGSLWLLIEVWPAIMIGLAAWLITSGAINTSKDGKTK